VHRGPEELDDRVRTGFGEVVEVFRIQDGKIKLFRDCVGAQSVPDLT
jgi:hypothetical protein